VGVGAGATVGVGVGVGATVGVGVGSRPVAAPAQTTSDAERSRNAGPR
jgi:hypothetical protein